MKIGDLVRLKDPRWRTLGIVIGVGNHAEVLWCNSSYVYLEPFDKLEVVNESR